MRSAPLSSDKSSSSSSSSFSSLSFLSIQKMIKLWSAIDQTTPRVNADGHERPNPFEVQSSHSPRSSSNGLATPTLTSPAFSIHHHLLGTGSPSLTTANADLTPPGPITPLSGAFAARIPTTQISLHAPDFSMRNTKKSPNLSDSMENKSNTPSSSSPSTRTSSIASTSTAPPHSTGGTSKGQIHVKLISARGLNVTSVRSRPYVVVQFEQNEFVSRDPTDEMDKEVKGTATALSRASSSIALSALSSIGVPRPPGKPSPGNSPPSSLSCNQPSPTNQPSTTQGLFGRLSAHNPVWKHEVSLSVSHHQLIKFRFLILSSDVTSEESLVSFNLYDRVADHLFLGTVQIKPVLIHDHTVDQWYKYVPSRTTSHLPCQLSSRPSVTNGIICLCTHRLRPFENEVISGEMRVQITFEQYKVR